MIDLTSLKRIPTTPRIGIYFLFRGSDLVYIGQSVDIHRRIQDHKQSKIFDSFSYIEYPEHQLSRKEKDLIKFFNPPLNVIHATSTEIPETLATEEFNNWYKVQINNTAKMYEGYFVAKLRTGMCYSKISSDRRKGYSQYNFKDIKGEFSGNGSAIVLNYSGWFKFKNKKYWFEPKSGRWVIHTL